jgi:hypothetical protein
LAKKLIGLGLSGMAHPLLIAALFVQTILSQTGTGVVTGTLLSSEGKPAVKVRIAAMAVQEGVPTVDLAVFASITETDAAGNYRLENILPGRYFIIAGPLENLTYYPGAALASGATAIAVAAGATNNPLNFSLSRENVSGIIQVVVQRLDTSAPIREVPVTLSRTKTTRFDCPILTQGRVA